MLDSTPDAFLPPAPTVAPIRDSSDTRVAVLAFVADDDTEGALRAGLLDVREGVEIRRGTILHAIKHLARQPTPRTLVVDISHVADPLVELTNLARVCTPDVAVLVIGKESNIGFYRNLVRNMGVAEYVHKPLTRDNVVRLFVPHIGGLALDANAPHSGRVIAVCGARGGVGTTTVAVNLALQLAATTRGHVALLDLDLRRGSTALMLGVKAAGGLRIALEQPERADALFLDRVSVEINDRLRLIGAEEPLDGFTSPTPDGMRWVLDMLCRRFNYVVMDLPLPATPAEMHALRAARHLLMVMGPDVVGIRDASRLREWAKSVGTSLNSIVLNRLGMPGGLTLAMIEQGLGSAPAIQIPDLGRQMGRAANLGKSALGECPAFNKAMELLTREVCGSAASPMLPAGSRWLPDWMVRR